MAIILVSTFSIFVAASLFYEAHPARAASEWARQDPSRERLIRLAAWGLLLAGLALLVLAGGLARGVSVWVGLVMAMSLSNIMLASWHRTVHRYMSLGASVGLILSLVALSFGDSL